MTTSEPWESIRHRYQDAWIRVTRITRLEEKWLGRIEMDAETAWTLGTDNIGLFVGDCRSLGRTIDMIRPLHRATPRCQWVIVAATKKMAAVLIQRWFREDLLSRVATTTLKLPQVYSNLVLATPESLRRIENSDVRSLGGILIIDMQCHIHKARQGIRRGRFYVPNDRPQLIADFRSRMTIGEWAPPVVFMTQKRAKALNTDPVRRAYCLDGWWFADGQSLRCGPRRRHYINDLVYRNESNAGAAGGAV